MTRRLGRLFQVFAFLMLGACLVHVGLRALGVPHEFALGGGTFFLWVMGWAQAFGDGPVR